MIHWRTTDTENMLQTNLTNEFLIAMPALHDPNFFHTVTYICVHNEDGAMGLVVNRPLDVDLGEVLEHMELETGREDINNTIVFDGGPVQRDRGFVLHQPAGEWDTMLNINNELAISTSRDILSAIAQGKGPPQILVALGYAGWGSGQLEQELSENAWLNGPADLSILFDLPPEQRWQAAAAHIGVDLDRLSNQTGHA